MSIPQTNYISQKLVSELETGNKIVLGLAYDKKCNFDCTGCCVTPYRGLPGALSVDGFLVYLGNYQQYTALVSVVSMGEPLLREEGKNFFDVVQLAIDVGIPVVTFTNGSQIDEKVAKELVARKISVIGKLQHTNPAENSRVTGVKRPYRGYVTLDSGLEVPSYVANLLDAGIDRGNLTLNTVIFRYNANVVGEMREALKQDEIVHFSEFPDPIGKMADTQYREENEPTKEEKEQVTGQISKIDNRFYDLGKEERHFDIRLTLGRIGKVVYVGPLGKVSVPKNGCVAASESPGFITDKIPLEVLLKNARLI